MLKIAAAGNSAFADECFVVGNVKICTDMKPPSTDMDIRSFILTTTGSNFLAYGGFILK